MYTGLGIRSVTMIVTSRDTPHVNDDRSAHHQIKALMSASRLHDDRDGKELLKRRVEAAHHVVVD